MDLHRPRDLVKNPLSMLTVRRIYRTAAVAASLVVFTGLTLVGPESAAFAAPPPTPTPTPAPAEPGVSDSNDSPSTPPSLSPNSTAAAPTSSTMPESVVPSSQPSSTAPPLSSGKRAVNAGETCYLIVNKVEPGQAASDVVGKGCEAGLQAKLGSSPQARPNTEAAAVTAVPIVELYADTSYGGKSFIIYGNQGPCDSSGYSISDASNPNTQVGGISSYIASGNCQSQQVFNQTQFGGQGGTFNGYRQPAVGTAFDNKVLSLKLTSQTSCTLYSQTNGSVCGAIRDKYNQLGGPSGFLGYPTSSELTNPDGLGKRNTFQNRGASIYWSPSSGAAEIEGAIFQDWGRLGYENGVLGYPTSDQLNNPDGVGKRNTFAKSGAIYYSPASGAHQVSGAIYQNWGTWGWETSPVGYPLSDEVDNARSPYAEYGSRRNDFQQGQIYNKSGAVSRGVWITTGGASAAAKIPSQLPSTTSARSALSPTALAAQAGTGCPAGTTNYAPPKQIYNCLVVVTDTSGYPAGIRAGFSAHNGNPNPPLDDNASTLQPFGSAHAADDHNVLFRNQQLVIQDAIPYRDMNAPNYLRYLYTMTFQIEGNPTNSINVVVQKQPDVEDQAPDDYDIGLITGYCSRGVPNLMNYQGFCPSNLPAPFGNGPGGLPQ